MQVSQGSQQSIISQFIESYFLDTKNLQTKVSKLQVDTTPQKIRSILLRSQEGPLPPELGLYIIFYSAVTSNYQVLKSVVESGVYDVNAKDSDGRNPLHFAAILKQQNLVAFLTQCGCDVSSQDYFGNTPLHFAFRYGASDVSKVLIQQGANLFALNKFQLDPVAECILSEHFQLLQLLRSSSPLQRSTVKIYEGGYTLLHLACALGKQEAINFLIQNGSLINQNQTDQNLTPLHCAVINSNVGCIRKLLQCKADASLRTAAGDSAIDLAKKAQSESKDQIVQLLWSYQSQSSQDSSLDSKFQTINASEFGHSDRSTTKKIPKVTKFQDKSVKPQVNADVAETQPAGAKKTHTVGASSTQNAQNKGIEESSKKVQGIKQEFVPWFNTFSKDQKLTKINTWLTKSKEELVALFPDFPDQLYDQIQNLQILKNQHTCIKAINSVREDKQLQSSINNIDEFANIVEEVKQSQEATYRYTKDPKIRQVLFKLHQLTLILKKYGLQKQIPVQDLIIKENYDEEIALDKVRAKNAAEAVEKYKLEIIDHLAGGAPTGRDCHTTIRSQSDFLDLNSQSDSNFMSQYTGSIRHNPNPQRHQSNTLSSDSLKQGLDGPTMMDTIPDKSSRESTGELQNAQKQVLGSSNDAERLVNESGNKFQDNSSNSSLNMENHSPVKPQPVQAEPSTAPADPDDSSKKPKNESKKTPYSPQKQSNSIPRSPKVQDSPKAANSESRGSKTQDKGSRNASEWSVKFKKDDAQLLEKVSDSKKGSFQNTNSQPNDSFRVNNLQELNDYVNKSQRKMVDDKNNEQNTFDGSIHSQNVYSYNNGQVSLSQQSAPQSPSYSKESDFDDPAFTKFRKYVKRTFGRRLKDDQIDKLYELKKAILINGGNVNNGKSYDVSTSRLIELQMEQYGIRQKEANMCCFSSGGNIA